MDYVAVEQYFLELDLITPPKPPPPAVVVKKGSTSLPSNSYEGKVFANKTV